MSFFFCKEILRWMWCQLFFPFFSHKIRMSFFFNESAIAAIWEQKRKYAMTCVHERLNEWMKYLNEWTHWHHTWLFGCGYARVRKFCAKFCQVKSQCLPKNKYCKGSILQKFTWQSFQLNWSETQWVYSSFTWSFSEGILFMLFQIDLRESQSNSKKRCIENSCTQKQKKTLWNIETKINVSRDSTWKIQLKIFMCDLSCLNEFVWTVCSTQQRRR